MNTTVTAAEVTGLANGAATALTLVAVSAEQWIQCSMKVGDSFTLVTRQAENTTASTSGELTFQIGSNSNQTLNVGIDSMKTADLNIDKVDVTTAEKATAAISTLDDAIKTVSAERSKLGAYQNRLEHTINNLGTSSENLTAAESRIRDVDYALAA